MFLERFADEYEPLGSESLEARLDSKFPHTALGPNWNQMAPHYTVKAGFSSVPVLSQISARQPAAYLLIVSGDEEADIAKTVIDAR